MAAKYVSQGVINSPDLIQQTFKVLVIEINPKLVTLQNAPKAGDVIHFPGIEQKVIDEKKRDIEQGSGGYLKVDLTWEYLDEFPTYTEQIIREDGSEDNKLDEESYLTALTYYETGEFDWYQMVMENIRNYVDPDSNIFDYIYLINKFDLINRRNNNEFDQVWIVAIDPLCASETVMVGKDAYYYNDNTIDFDCEPFIISLTYMSRRDTSLHSWNYASEYILSKVYEPSFDFYEENSVSLSTPEDYENLNDFEKFVISDYINSGTLQSVGTVQCPFNSSDDYGVECTDIVDTLYTNWIDADIDELGTEITSAGRVWENWQENIDLPSDDELGWNRLWNRFWLYLIPKKQGYSKYGYLKNWFKYIYSLNYVVELSADFYDISAYTVTSVKLPYTAIYKFGEIEYGVVLPGNNVHITDTGVVNFQNGELRSLSVGETDITYYRDGNSITYHVVVQENPHDVVKPVLAAETNGYEIGKWTNNNVTFTVVNTANNREPVLYYYSTDGKIYNLTEQLTYTISDNGEYTYYFYAVSEGDVRSDVLVVTVRIDKRDYTIPILQIDGNGYQSDTLSYGVVTLNVNNIADNTSPVTYYYSDDGENYTETTTLEYTYSEYGSYNFYMYAVNEAGIKSEVVSYIIHVDLRDKIKPIVHVDSQGYQSGELIEEDSLIITLENLAHNTEPVTYWFSKDNANNFVKLESPTIRFTVKNNGKYYFKIRSNGDIDSSFATFVVNIKEKDYVMPILKIEANGNYQFMWANDDVTLTILNVAPNTDYPTYYMSEDGIHYVQIAPTYIARKEDGDRQLYFYGVSSGGVKSAVAGYTVKFDFDPPSAYIEYNGIKWDSLKEGGILFNVNARIPCNFNFNAYDSTSGIKKKSYYIDYGLQYLTQQELYEVDEWVEVSDFDTLVINDADNNRRFVIYLCAEDFAGNKTYICTGGLITENVYQKYKSRGFTYYGKSTLDIIEVPLVLVSIGTADYSQALGVNRNLQAGDITISRPFNNEYGTINDHLQFSYGLIKADYEPFTDYEQMIVEAWLTSPKLSSSVGIFDCEGIEKYKYFGLFTNTVWLNAGENNFVACVFTFTVNGSYPYEEIDTFGTPYESVTIDMDEEERNTACLLCFTQGIFALDNDGAVSIPIREQHLLKLDEGFLTITDYKSTEITEIDNSEDTVIGLFDTIFSSDQTLIRANYEYSPTMRFVNVQEEEYILVEKLGYIVRVIPDDTAFDHVRGKYDLDVPCFSQEYEEYVYPVIEITPFFSGSLPQELSIANITDDNKEMKIDLPNNYGIRFDCKKCMVTELNTNIPVFSFKDIGWEDVGDVYWLRLKPGMNKLKVSGCFNVRLVFYIVKKKAGGWLI